MAEILLNVVTGVQAMAVHAILSFLVALSLLFFLFLFLGLPSCLGAADK